MTEKEKFVLLDEHGDCVEQVVTSTAWNAALSLSKKGHERMVIFCPRMQTLYYYEREGEKVRTLGSLALDGVDLTKVPVDLFDPLYPKKHAVYDSDGRPYLCSYRMKTRSTPAEREAAKMDAAAARVGSAMHEANERVHGSHTFFVGNEDDVERIIREAGEAAEERMRNVDLVGEESFAGFTDAASGEEHEAKEKAALEEMREGIAGAFGGGLLGRLLKAGMEAGERIAEAGNERVVAGANTTARNYDFLKAMADEKGLDVKDVAGFLLDEGIRLYKGNMVSAWSDDDGE